MRHLHANRNWVVVSHLFPAVDIGVTASSVAVAIFLGAVVLSGDKDGINDNDRGNDE